MVRPRRSGYGGQDRDGSGLTFLLVILVVVAIAGAKLVGFKPKNAEPVAGNGTLVPETQAAMVLISSAHPSENYSPASPHAKGAGDVVTVSQALVAALQAEKQQAQLVIPTGTIPWSEAFNIARTALQPALGDGSKVAAIIDIHRDALDDKPDGYCTVFVEGRPVAKVLLVVGDLDNAKVEENLAFAQQLRANLEAIAPGITRGVKILHQAINGDLHPRFVQLHIGEYTDNNIDEALAAAQIVAKALVKTLKQ
jgi:stage II sporulation protein P